MAHRPSRRVAIYLGRGEELTRHALLWYLCDRWRAAGAEVLLLNDPAQRVDADAAIIHVDATHRPAEYDAIPGWYPRVINGGVRDISKRRISDNLLHRNSVWAGPVIVKTDGNCFGRPDFAVALGTRGRMRALGTRLLDRALPTYRAARDSGTYPVYPNMAAVPTRDWWDRRLVIEKFLPEREGELYRLRTWSFFGDRETASLSVSASPVVKRSSVIRSEFIQGVPESLRAVRRRLGFDYGKFDFVLHGGQPILLDANSTPGCTGRGGPRLDAICDQLAAGLFASELPQGASAGPC